MTTLVLAGGIQATHATAPPPVEIAKLAPESGDAAPKVKQLRTGLASYYGPGFHGRKTSSGEIFNKYAMVAAHPTYPAGTKVRITNLENGREVKLRINDRGPVKRIQKQGVIIDVSEGAAGKLKMVHDGRVRVKLEVLEWGDKTRKS